MFFPIDNDYKCEYEECPKKDRCYRYTSREDEGDYGFITRVAQPKECRDFIECKAKNSKEEKKE